MDPVGEWTPEMLELRLDGIGTLQAQLQRVLKGLLLEGHIAAGQRLPGSRALAQRMGMARNTVIAAYAQLEAEGFLQARGGSGFVALAGARRTLPADATLAAVPRLSDFARAALDLAVQRPIARHLHPAPRYDLIYGRPLPQAALMRRWRLELANAVAQIDPDYPPVSGLPKLRQALAGYLARRRGFAVDPARILITSGAQQALDLCVRTLAAAHSLAILEDPHYQGTRQTLAAAGVERRYLAVDANGLDPGGLPEQHGALLFLTPAHQFPRGCVLALERRLHILEWARRCDSWVIEDDYDGEFRFDAQPLAALKALDRDDRVIYVGTFSKALFPALRLGFLVLPAALVDAFEAVKWLSDRGNAAIEQQALANLIDSGRFERLLRQAGRALDERRRALLRALQEYCSDRVEIEGNAAGMHLTVWLNGRSSADLPDLLSRARACGLGLYPITPYFSQAPQRAGLLLGYAGLAPRDFAEVGRRLALLLGMKS